MILDQKIIFHNDSGIMEKIFWVQDWVKKPLLDPEMKKNLNDDEVIISYRQKYIIGFTGRETEINLIIIKVKIIEVKEL
jgi:hypothetical protein